MATDPFDMTDEELEAAFRDAKAELDSPDVGDDDSDDDYDNHDPSPQDSDDDYQEDDDDFDSDDDGSSDDSDEPSDEEVDDDNDQDDGDDVPPTDNTDSDDDTNPVDKEPASKLPGDGVHVFKANGQEYEFTEDEMRTQFPRIFGQAMDYTRKMQAIKPWRRTIDAIEQAQLSHDDVNLMIDVLSGNKDAIAAVLQRTGVDVLDIDSTDQPYVANQYGRDGKTLDITEIFDSIKHDPEYSVTHRVLSEVWDETSWNTLSNDPSKIRALHEDIKSGIYATVQPIANKLKIFDNARKSDLDYYLQAGRQYFSELEQENLTQNLRQFQEQHQARVNQVKNQDKKRKATKQSAGNRKAATLPAKSTQRGGVVDYIDASDEQFEEWLADLKERE